jgi:hypothetical protein
VGAIVVGLRPGDHKRLKELAKVQGRPPQELAGIYLERAIRRVRVPATTPALDTQSSNDQREPIGAA